MRAVRVVLLLVGFAVAANAQSPIDANVMREFQAGVDAFRLGNFDEARVHLKRAQLMNPKLPGPHRFLAAVAHAQRQWDDCIADARKALALNPASQELADTRSLHDDCRNSAGRAPYRGNLGDGAAISVTTNVPTAMVKIGGLTYGSTPIAPRPIAAGRLAIDIEKFGYATAHVDIDALPGIVTDVIVELQAGSEPEIRVKPRTGWLVVPRGTAQIEIDGVAVEVPSNGRIELSPGVRVVEVRAQGRDPWRRRIAITAELDTPIAPVLSDSAPRESKRRIGYVLAGGGLGLAALGLTAFYVARDATNEARDILRVEVARPPGDATPPIRTRADFENARSKAIIWGTLSNLSYGAALVAGGIGGYLWYRHRAPSNDAPEFAIAPVAGGAVVTRSGTW